MDSHDYWLNHRYNNLIIDKILCLTIMTNNIKYTKISKLLRLQIINLTILPCRKTERQSQLPVSQLRFPRHLPRPDQKKTTQRRRIGRTIILNV